MTRSFAKAALCASALFALSAPVHAAAVIGGSDLLTPTHAAQMETWLTGDPQLSYSGSLAFTNIYDKAPGDTSVDFHAAADNMGPTFFVVEATAIGTGITQLIGGYKPISWTSVGGYITTPDLADRIAFIFNLISATTLQQGEGEYGEYQSYNLGSRGPSMGGGLDIYILADLATGSVDPLSYCVNVALSCPGGANILGTTGFKEVTYGQLEVFTIAAAEVPIPAAAPLLLGALGLTGWIARRRKS